VGKVRRRLSKWKGKSISMAGRLCLIKSVLSSLPLFYLSLFKILIMVMKEIMRLQRNFYWDGVRKVGKSCGPRGRRCVSQKRKEG